jgi:hypothetical protein
MLRVIGATIRPRDPNEESDEPEKERGLNNAPPGRREPGVTDPGQRLAEAAFAAGFGIG